MRNRAKCKLCKDVLESFHQHDYVSCKCGEIGIDGGNHSFKASAKDWKNFLRIADDDTEITPTIVDNEESKEEPMEEPKKLSREELIKMLDNMADNIEKLPQSAMSLPVNHYDLWSALTLISAIFKEKE